VPATSTLDSSQLGSSSSYWIRSGSSSQSADYNRVPSCSCSCHVSRHNGPILRTWSRAEVIDNVRTTIDDDRHACGEEYAYPRNNGSTPSRWLLNRARSIVGRKLWPASWSYTYSQVEKDWVSHEVLPLESSSSVFSSCFEWCLQNIATNSLLCPFEARTLTPRLQFILFTNVVRYQYTITTFLGSLGYSVWQMRAEYWEKQVLP
jgi:hypothetical protein